MNNKKPSDMFEGEDSSPRRAFENATTPSVGGMDFTPMNNKKGFNKEEMLEESELAVFWDEISTNLPKSIEREALGDKKIFSAFRIAYPKIKSHIVKEARKERDKEIVKILNSTVMQHVPDDSTTISHRMLRDFIWALKTIK